jgi:hypothetical protein
MQSDLLTNPVKAASKKFQFRNSASLEAEGNKTLDHAREIDDNTFHLLNLTHSNDNSNARQ